MKKKPPKHIWVVVLDHADDDLEIIQACDTRKAALREARSDRACFGWKTFVREYRLVAPKKRKAKR